MAIAMLAMGSLIGAYGLAPMLRPPEAIPGVALAEILREISPEEREILAEAGIFPEDSAWRTGLIRLVGSTTVLPIAEECAKEFMKLHDGVSIVVEGGGTGVGIKGLIDGICHIGLASRELSDVELKAAEEKGISLVLHTIAADGLAVIVHPGVTEGLEEPLKLTLEQVGRIYSGQYTKWSEVDPRLPDREIVIFSREDGSGTRDTFEEFCLEPFGWELTPRASIAPSNPAMRTNVEITPYSIGYVSLGFVTGDIQVILLAESEGEPYYEPTRENVVKGVYPISRLLYMVTVGYPESGSLVDRFLDFVRSPTGQSIVEEAGFVAYYPLE